MCGVPQKWDIEDEGEEKGKIEIENFYC